MSKVGRQLAAWWSGVTSQDQPREPEPLYQKREMTSFFGSLSPDQRSRALAYRGEEDHGDPMMRAGGHAG